MPLGDVTIVITTFHRRGYLSDCFIALENNLHECDVVVSYDDDMGATYQHRTYWAKLPYDSGLTAKRNAGVRLVETKYTLIGCDDFDFSTPEARASIRSMAEVLDSNSSVDLVVGRVNNRDYQGDLEYIPGEYIKEHPLDMKRQLPFALKPHSIWKIDIGVNFFLARTEVLREVPWDETIKPIGGEHADLYLDLKTANKLVAFLPQANINTMPYNASKQHPGYRELRNRAYLGHALMLKKRGVTRYIGFGEQP